MGLDALFAVVLGKGIGSTTHDFHALPVVLRVGMPVLDGSSCTGDITITLPSVPGIPLIKIIPGPALLMMLAPRSLLRHRGGTSPGISSILFVYHSYLGAAHFLIFDVGVSYGTAFLIFWYHFPSFTRDYPVSFRNRSSFRLLLLTPVTLQSICLNSGGAHPFLVTTVLGFLRLLLKLGVSIDINQLIQPCLFSLLPSMCHLHNKSGLVSVVPKKAGVRVKVLSSKHT